ncbi:MAG: TRAP transporter large permease [Chloroflexi bacterium]|nr:TRAP transporter large permease [Chloroflexota bacterium]
MFDAAAFLGIFFLLILIGVPVAYALGAAAVVLMLTVWQTPLSQVVIRLAAGPDSYAFIAVPLFILTGELMNTTGLTSRLVRFARATVGFIQGGLSHVVVVTNMLMAGISGSALADASATGGVLIPAMKMAGYRPSYAAAIVAASATIGPVIPPSIPMVLYGLTNNISIGRLFLGGVVPGVLMALFLIVAGYFKSKRAGYPVDARVPIAAQARSFGVALPALVLPVLIVAGLVLGTFTPTEASAVAVAGALLIGGVAYREITLKGIGHALHSSTVTSGAVMLIVASSALFGWVLALYQPGDKLAAAVADISDNPQLILLFINIVFIVLGCFLDTIPILLIIVPLFVPLAERFSIDLVHFGVVIILNLMIGLLTPPYGLAMLLTCRMAGVTVAEFWRDAWPFVIALMFVLGLITYIPELVLFLPNIVMGPS